MLKYEDYVSKFEDPAYCKEIGSFLAKTYLYAGRVNREDRIRVLAAISDMRHKTRAGTQTAGSPEVGNDVHDDETFGLRVPLGNTTVSPPELNAVVHMYGHMHDTPAARALAHVALANKLIELDPEARGPLALLLAGE